MFHIKVSIITKTSTYNFGAALQAYALQSYIESHGHECEHINHAGTGRWDKVNIFDLSLDGLMKTLYKPQIDKGRTRFREFYAEYLHIGERYSDFAALKANPPDADVFITGSDQVWNPRDEIEKYFLEFVPQTKKKISYAASIGDSFIPDDKKDYIRNALRSFESISVREKSASAIISSLTEKTVNINCDPIFLLDKDQWRNVETPIHGLPEKYILCYMIYKPDWFNTFVKELKKKTGYKIVFVGTGGFRPVVNDKYIRSAGPQEFLYLIDHASAVLTSSFHGTAFSILFGKPFISLPNPKRIDRIHDMLTLFGLLSNEMTVKTDADGFVNYNRKATDNIIKEERNRSTQYLLSCMD